MPIDLPTPIGVGVVADEPSADAKRANEAALAHHRAGRLAEALESFDVAIAATAGYPGARYNRTCALARLGRLEQAERELSTLLAEDLPTYRSRYEQDEDLAALRARPHRARLERRVSELLVRYREAIARGVPAMTYFPRVDAVRTDDGWHHQTPFTQLRLGVYDLPSRRFVPVSPSLPRLLGGMISRDLDRVALVSGDVQQGTCWHVFPVLRAIDLYSLSDPGRRAVSLEVPSKNEEWSWDSAYETFVELAGDRAKVRQGTVEHCNRVWGREVGGAISLQPGAPFQRISHRAMGQPHLAFYANPFQWQALPRPVAGVRSRGTRLEIEGMFELSKGQHQPTLLMSPGGERLVAATRYYGNLDCDRTPPLITYHVVDLVDLRSGKVSRLSQSRGTSDGWPADGFTAAAFAPDGTLLLQIGERVRRYPPDSADPVDDVLPGVRIHVAQRGDDDCGC